MQAETEPQVPPEYREPSSSSGWQVAAICAFIVVFILTGVSVTLSIAYLAEHRKVVEGQYPNYGAYTTTPVMVSPWAGPAGVPGVWTDPESEPVDPPYPTVADLRPKDLYAQVGEPSAVPAKDTAQMRFARLGVDAWNGSPGVFTPQLAVSPSGKAIAYVANHVLFAGLMDGPISEVYDEGPVLAGGGPAGGGGMAGPPGAFGQMPGTAPFVTSHLQWTQDSSAVSFSDSRGKLREFDIVNNFLKTHPLTGDSPVSMGGEKFVFRRTNPSAKTDATGYGVARDRGEIVLGNVSDRTTRVLLTEKDSLLFPRAVSPDGKALILASEPAAGGKTAKRQFQLFEINAQAGGEPKPLGPLAKELDTAFFVQEGKGIILSLKPLAYSPDCWEEPSFNPTSVEVYHLDRETEKLTRLTRTGAVMSLVGVARDDLYFQTWDSRLGTSVIRRVPLVDLIAFAAKEPSKPVRTVELWTKLIDDVVKESDVSSGKMDAATAARGAEVFARLFKERFDVDAPRNAAGWERLQRELIALNLPIEVRSRFVLVFGICWGEYLRVKHGAVWELAAGPVASSLPPIAEQENPFAVMVNPFALAASLETNSANAASPILLALLEADGRTLVLTNSNEAGLAGVEKLAGGDLANLQELFDQKKPEEAEQLLLALVSRPPQDKNPRLISHVGQMLYQNQRTKALQQLMEAQLKQKKSEWQYSEWRYHNLLGLTYLATDPKTAAEHFRNALRCNLISEAAMLNLALACEKMGEKESAAQCYRKYLKMSGNKPVVADVRQRLAALQGDGPQ